MEPADSELVERAAAGDRDAWQALVARHSGRLWAIARFFGLGRDRAEDVVQTCWLRLLDNIELIRDPNAVGGWLRSVARNEAIRIVRGQNRMVSSGDDHHVFDRSAAGPGPDDRVIADDDRVRLARAFAKLDERCRLYLRYFFSSERLSYAEIAAELDRPVSSLGPTRQRCLRRLRGLFVAEGGTIAGGEGSREHDE